MNSKPIEHLTPSQLRIMEDAWDMYSHSWHGNITPIGEYTANFDVHSDYERLAEMKLLRRVLVLAGWRHNEYGYEITPAGIKLMRETEYVKRRTYRAELLDQYREGLITEQQLLEALENSDKM